MSRQQLLLASPLDVTLTENVRKYIRQAKSPRTLKAYRSDLAHFAAYCEAQRVPALPASPATVAGYLAALADAGMRPATLSRRLAAIAKAHAVEDLESPCSMQHAVVKEVWAGIRRSMGIAQTRKAAATTDYLKQMLLHLPNSLTGQRDKALLLIGFAGALRRSELVALTYEDVTFAPEGIVLAIRRSKSDQEGAGHSIAIALGKSPQTCPVHALRDWLQAARIRQGPLFRAINRWGQLQETALSDQVVSLMVKKYASLAGLDPAAFGGHSLRAGLVTAAAQAGAPEHKIMEHSRHRSTAMLRRYIRETNLFRANVTADIGL